MSGFAPVPSAVVDGSSVVLGLDRDAAQWAGQLARLRQGVMAATLMCALLAAGSFVLIEIKSRNDARERRLGTLMMWSTQSMFEMVAEVGKAVLRQPLNTPDGWFNVVLILPSHSLGRQGLCLPPYREVFLSIELLFTYSRMAQFERTRRIRSTGGAPLDECPFGYSARLGYRALRRKMCAKGANRAQRKTSRLRLLNRQVYSPCASHRSRPVLGTTLLRTLPRSLPLERWGDHLARVSS